MAYTILHNGAYWFQIRVPKRLAIKFGQIIKLNLQTTDRGEAQRLAYRLAGDWLDRFAAERLGVSDAKGEPPTALLETPARRGTRLAEPGSHLQDAATKATPRKQSSRATVRLTDELDELYRYWKQQNPERADSTLSEVRLAVKEFKPLVKGKTLLTIERSDLIRYRDQLLQKRLARSTISRKVGFISSLLQVAYDAGQLPQNVGRGIRIPKAKVETLVRRPFTRDELATVFNSPVYRDGARQKGGGGEAAVWVPMIALATGARLGEICQLRTEDLWVDAEHGPLLRITDENAAQRIKTSGSRRTIPIHPDLVAAGLMRYWRKIRDDDREWLFPALEPDHDGRRGGTFGLWFSRYLRSPGGCDITDPRVVFYAFRHTFKTLCRQAGISEEIHDALTGHVTGSVGRSYGQMPIEPLVRAVHSIRLPIRLPVLIAA